MNLSDFAPPRSLCMRAVERKLSTVKSSTDPLAGRASVVNIATVMSGSCTMSLRGRWCVILLCKIIYTPGFAVEQVATQHIKQSKWIVSWMENPAPWPTKTGLNPVMASSLYWMWIKPKHFPVQPVVLPKSSLSGTDNVLAPCGESWKD